MESIELPESEFVRVRCRKCNNEQVLFNKAAMAVKCLVCSSVLAEPTGGKARIQTDIIEILD